MNTMDSIQNAVKTTIAIVGCVVLNCSSVQAEPPSTKVFSKAPELVLTLSDDMAATEKTNRPFASLDSATQNNSNKFITRQGNKRPLNMNCGMNANPYADTDNSFINRLSGACDLTYNY